MMRAARDEYGSIVAKLRVQHGLKTLPPEASDYSFSPGDSVYVYKEKHRHWTGPHVVSAADGKDIAVHLGEATGPRHFSICQVKPALLSAPVCFLGSVADASERISVIQWTEVIDRGDTRAKSPQMKAAIGKEVRGLIARGTFRLKIVEDRSGKNIVPSKFVLAIKHEDDGQEIYKARLCLGGHRDFLKNHMVHTATTLTQTLKRLILAFAAIFSWNVWTTDVKQA
jgi:hypothetical protein